MIETLTEPIGNYILAKAENKEPGKFEWHRVKNGVAGAKIPSLGMVHMTTCGKRIVGMSVQDSKGHSLCEDCK